MVSADSLNRRGIELQNQGDETGAFVHYLAALESDPHFMPALANMTGVLSASNKLAVAKTALVRLSTLFPNDGIQLSNLGNVLFRLELYTESEKILLRAADLCPDNVGVWHNLALLAARMNQNDKALAYFSKVEALKGGASHDVENDKAHIFLAKGDFKSAFPLYESRWWTMRHLMPWDFHIKEWMGEDLRGKTILFHAEQGFGDSIMCARFARNLKALGATVIMALPIGLVRLFEFQEWCEVIDLGQMTQEIAARCDFHSPMWSAVRWLGLEVKDISPQPYLKAPPIATQGLLSGFFNVGICWASGRRGGPHDWRRRVSSLEDWLPLAENPRVRLISLMKEEEFDDEIQSIGAQALVESRRTLLVDWADTALLIDKLDLVITVDTAVAHLAAALGKTTWMLSQFTPCWRWWNIASNSGLPWYETMVIFRQWEPNSWQKQILETKEILDLLVADDQRHFATAAE